MQTGNATKPYRRWQVAAEEAEVDATAPTPNVLGNVAIDVGLASAFFAAAWSFPYAVLVPIAINMTQESEVQPYREMSCIGRWPTP